MPLKTTVNAEPAAFAPPATPGLLRALGLALLAHAALVLALVWGVQWRRDAQTLAVEAELWASVPVEAAPPAPDPEPTPPPPAPEPPPPPVDVTPPGPTQAEIALERERQHQAEAARAAELRTQRLKAEQAQREADRLKVEHQKAERLKAEQQRAQQLKREQVDQQKKAQAQQLAQEKKLAQQLEAQRQKNLQRMSGLAGASGGPAASGSALQSAGPSAGYAGRIRARVKPNIVFTDSLAGNPSAEVEVRTAPDGTIVARRITRSSGVPDWDAAVLKALDKTQVLPRDTDGRVPPSLLLVFRPKD